MRAWLEARGFWELGGTLALLAAGLLLLLLLTLPPERRSTLKRPTGVFLVYVGLFALAQVFGEHPSQWVRVAAFASILVVITRSAILLATETWLGRWLLPPVPRIITDLVQAGLFAVVALLTLHTAGFEPGQLLTTSALITAVVGLALQETLGNLFAGLSLQLGRQFDVGDWIDIDTDRSKNGRVIEIGWRTTKVMTLDDVEIIVPNGILARSPIRIYTQPVRRERRCLPFGAAYAVPPGRVRDVVEAAVRDVARVLPEPAPQVVLRGFAESQLSYELRYYTDDHGLAQITDSEVLTRIWHALARAEIAIPFAQHDVHLFHHDAEHRQSEAAEALKRRTNALENVPMFQSLPEEILVELAQESGERTWAAGERVVRRGDEGNELFVVVSGSVSVRAGEPEREVAELGPGAFFGEMSLLTGERRSATVRAAAETRLVVVGHEGLRRLLRRHPELYELLSATLAERQVALESAAVASEEVTEQEVLERSGVLLRRIQAFFRSS